MFTSKNFKYCSEFKVYKIDLGYLYIVKNAVTDLKPIDNSSNECYILSEQEMFTRLPNDQHTEIGILLSLATEYKVAAELIKYKLFLTTEDCKKLGFKI